MHRIKTKIVKLFIHTRTVFLTTIFSKADNFVPFHIKYIYVLIFKKKIFLFQNGVFKKEFSSLLLINIYKPNYN